MIPPHRVRSLKDAHMTGGILLEWLTVGAENNRRSVHVTYSRSELRRGFATGGFVAGGDSDWRSEERDGLIRRDRL